MVNGNETLSSCKHLYENRMYIVFSVVGVGGISILIFELLFVGHWTSFVVRPGNIQLMQSTPINMYFGRI